MLDGDGLTVCTPAVDLLQDRRLLGQQSAVSVVSGWRAGKRPPGSHPASPRLSSPASQAWAEFVGSPGPLLVAWLNGKAKPTATEGLFYLQNKP